MEEQNYTIKAGTVVKINGIPIKVLADTPVFTHSENIPLIENEQEIIDPSPAT